MLIALITLGAGIAVGYLAQRSRLCFVGGLRDWLLIRDSDLLKGTAAFFLAAWIAFPLAALLGGQVWSNDQPQPATATLAAAQVQGTPVVFSVDPEAPPAPFRPWLFGTIAATAGAGLGFASVLGNGCPLRQHVLAAQGGRDAWFYLGGFYGAALLYLVGWS